MKAIITSIIFVILSFVSFSNDKDILKSTISQVTVYTQGAQIAQKASYSVKPGITELIIENISPSIDSKSLQIKASGSIILLDSKYTIYYPKPEEPNLTGLPLKIRQDIKKTQDSIQKINYEIQSLQDEIDVLNSTKSILTNNGAIKGQGKVNDSLNLLKQAVEYYAVKMMELNKKLQVLYQKKNEEVETRNSMNDRLKKLMQYQHNAELNPKQKGPIHRIVITVSAKEATSGKLDISYLVSKAGWTPLYDLRSDSESSKINLNYKALIHQNTGIDWEDVRISVSTNNPYQNKTKPNLHPWYIDYRTYYKKQENYQRGIKMESQSMDDHRSAAPSSQAKINENAERAITSDQFVEQINHLISAEFKIDLPYTIVSNNEQHMILIKNLDLDAHYQYYSAPKIDPSVYLLAQLTKLDELQLIPAKANIFFDGSYIGETYIDPTTMDDTLSLSLGKDPNIIVKRTLLKKESKEKITGNQLERTMSYIIEVKNFKSKSIELVIQDQLPISQNADIQIDAVELSKGKLNSQTGIITWNIKLKSKETQEIEFSYKVKQNKDQHLTLH